ncbi:MAG: preprotein translocase subunit SecE [Candidatus Peribacteria bacterium]|nr:preprotein translocase subunit SecE [Candidatus Peribacteria bacterium]
MFKFFSDSFRELKHVVWPTKKETKDYFTIVLVILVLL